MKPTLHPRVCLGTGMLWCVLLLLVFSLFSGCAATAPLGVPEATSFDHRMAYAYGTVTGIRNTTVDLLLDGHITADDAANLQTQANLWRTGLDITRGMARTDPQAADQRLNATMDALRAYQAYLRGRRASSAPAPKGAIR